jgi:hypothetical protein
MMTKASIQDLSLLKVVDQAASEIYYGGWQEWYGAWWRRMSGCGPTVVSTIISYLYRKHMPAAAYTSPMTKTDFIALMEEVWHSVTPTIRGIPTASALRGGAQEYIRIKGLNIALEEVDIPKSKHMRPDFKVLLGFLAAALSEDMPVAFLSLNKGTEEKLDDWHWVTLLSVEYEEDGSAAKAEITDEGRLLKVDLRRWYDTTSLGGGFVAFRINSADFA